MTLKLTHSPRKCGGKAKTGDTKPHTLLKLNGLATVKLTRGVVIEISKRQTGLDAMGIECKQGFTNGFFITLYIYTESGVLWLMDAS